MKILWTRGNEKINFKLASMWYALGVRGAAKSTFLEHTAMNYADKGAVIFDLFGSKDGEGLAWLRSPWAKDKNVLLVHGENVKVKGNYETKEAEALTLKDLEAYDLIISANPLYLNFDQEFYSAGKILDLMYKRITHKRLIFVIVREAANLYYSRLKISDDQVLAKAQCTYLLRESRHMGLSMGLDSLKFTSIDSDIRNLTDYMVLKSQGLFGLPSDLKWLYSYFNAHLLRNMPKQYFFIVSKSGALGIGEFPYHEWHKEVKENIVKVVGLDIEHGKEVFKGIDRGTFRTVGDKEHIEMVRLLIEENLGMVQIADKLSRSSKTINDHIKFHNRGVVRAGFCSRCKRASGVNANKMAERQYLDKETKPIPSV